MRQDTTAGLIDEAFAPSPAVGALWEHARRRPGQQAVIDPRVSRTFEELRSDVEALARALRDHGIRAGEPVLVLFDVCAESVVAYWALRAIEAVVVVGDPTGKNADVAHYLRVTGAQHVLAGRRAAEALEPPDGAAWHILEGGSEGALRRWALTPSPNAPATPGGAFEAAGDAAVVLFSSGTTGKPKAIVHSKASIAALHQVLLETWKLSPGDVVLGALPFHTIYGLIFSAASTIHSGATLVLLERFHPKDALATIERHRITTAALVPAMLIMMRTLEGNEGYDLSSLRAVYTASAPISESDIERFRAFSGASVIANYGMTEIPGAAVEPADAPHHAGSVGRVSPGFEVVVRDAEGTPLPIGETGEITMRGPTLMQGYLGDAAQTAERIRNGWIHSQDIGRIDVAGNIYLSGRSSDMIMRGGLNISPLEVENALSTHPDVLDVAVVGAPHAVLGQTVWAFVAVRAPEPGASLQERLTEHCRDLLSPPKVPARVLFVDEIPRNAGGKILRRQLLSDRDAAAGGSNGSSGKRGV